MTLDEPFTVERDGERTLKFHGELIARCSSDDERQSPDYSGSTGRWAELALYRTHAGKYICEQIGHTRWQGERTRRSGRVCDTTEDVFEFFGYGWLAKRLYELADIDAAELIE